MAPKKRDGLYKRGRIWWASKDPVTGRPQSTRCTSIDAARAWLNEREHLAIDPAYSASKTAQLGDWADRYLRSKVNRTTATRGATASKVKALLAVLGRERKLATISPGAIDDYIDARRTSEKPPVDYTIRREVNHLLAILALAKRSGCYSGDIDALMPPGFEGRYRPRQRALAEAELGAFLAALPTSRWRALAAVCVALGCRLSEACKLTPSDVDLEAGLVHVGGTKTDASNRELPILSPYRALLEATLPALPVGKISNIDRTFKIACRRAKIERCSPNDLRRTHSTLLGSRGVGDDVIARLLGHTTVALSKRTYNRARAAQLAPVVEGLLARAAPIVISTESLQISDNRAKQPEKGEDSDGYPRPPEPKVAGSNLAWRAENPPEFVAGIGTGAHEKSGDCPCATTNKRQSATPAAWSLAYAYASVLARRAA